MNSKKSGFPRLAQNSPLRAAVVAMTRVSAAVVAMVALAAPATSAEIYVLSGDTKLGNSNRPTYYGKIDIATGVYTQIADLNQNSIEVRGLSYDSSRSAFYAFVSTGTSAGDILYTLDTAGNLSTSFSQGLIAYTANSMAYNGAGVLYTYDYSNDEWASVDTTSGAKTTHGSSGYSASGPAGGRGVFFNGTYYTSLYGSGSLSNGAFGTVDVSTATWSFNSLSTASAYEFMNLATDGTTLYGVYADGSNARLYSIDASNGALTLLTNITGFGANYLYGAGMVSGASAVPGSGLAAIGSLGLAGLARRRRR